LFLSFTSDFGLRDYYAGALKGAVARHCIGATLVDISHQIEPFNIVQAAWVVRQVWHEFPAGTLHLLAVNCSYGPESRFVAVRRGEHFFFAPDNGLMTLLFDDVQPEDTQLIGVQNGHFSVKDIFATAAGQLFGGTPFEALGEPLTEPLLRRIGLNAVVTPTRIRGTVVHIDNFENVIVNIDRDTFEKAVKNRPFSLYFKRNDPITVLSTNYSDVPLGEPMCLFNSAGFLEIAVNFGKAATLLGLKTEDVVEVVFEE
jgi:S-adenosyl-L-methionine hydrolase (adenosine-forming)